MSNTRITAVNIPDRLAFDSDNNVLEVTTLLDSDGDETDDADRAAAAVVHLANGKWTYVLLNEYESGLAN